MARASSLRMPAVRDMVAAYKDGRTPVEEILRYHGVSSKALYDHLDRAGVPRRHPVKPRLEVGEVVDLSLHVLPCFPVRLVARPGCHLEGTDADCPLPEASLLVDSGALVASRASDSLAQPGEAG